MKCSKHADPGTFHSPHRSDLAPSLHAPITGQQTALLLTPSVDAYSLELRFPPQHYKHTPNARLRDSQRDKLERWLVATSVTRPGRRT